MEFLNIVTEKPSNPPWILRRGAEEIQKMFPKTTLNGEPRPVNYFVNYALYRPISGILVGHFTHLEHAGQWRKAFLETVDKFDYFTCTCKITEDILLELGAKAELIHRIRYGCDERMRRKPIFGVVGRTYPSGRKGEHLVKQMVRAGYDVWGWGRGWPVLNLSNDWETLPAFYESIDYLVVTSLNEGGPVPVVDALAAGVPVIAPNCGWSWEFPVIRYELGSWVSLKRTLEGLTILPTWEDWSSLHGVMMYELHGEGS